MQQGGWQWPGGKPIAVIFNVCLEAWSNGGDSARNRRIHAAEKCLTWTRR